MPKFPKHYMFIFVPPVRFEFRLPARSRFGEGRDFVLRISVFHWYLILGSTIA